MLGEALEWAGLVEKSAALLGRVWDLTGLEDWAEVCYHLNAAASLKEITKIPRSEPSVGLHCCFSSPLTTRKALNEADTPPK